MTEYIFKQYIDGKWQDAAGGGRWSLINPATEEQIDDLPFGDSADAERAIDAAAGAFETWSQTTPYERADILQKAAAWLQTHAKALARITTEESGKPYGESLAEWRSAPNYLIWAAEECKRIYGRTIPSRNGRRRIQVAYAPIGVVATITAWNFPVYNVVRAWSSALAAGCTVVGRPSEYTPRSAMLIAQALHEAGAPPGVINLINGEPEAIGQTLLDDKRVRKIHFTGSTRVGRLLMEGAARTVTQLSLELGGNAPLLLFPDAGDLEELAKQAVSWKLRNCGQVCVAPQRFYVHSQVVEAFSDHVTRLMQQQTVGNGLERSTTVGPLINERQRSRVEQMVAESAAAGAEILIGGRRPAAQARGYFYEPTVVFGVEAGMPLNDEEIFGPVLPIVPFDEVEEAIRLANDSDYGLASFVFTQNLNTALVVSEQLEYGMVCVNDWLPATPEAPFGGIKQSGLGRESGREGLYEYLEEKTVFFGGVDL